MGIERKLIDDFETLILEGARLKDTTYTLNHFNLSKGIVGERGSQNIPLLAVTVRLLSLDPNSAEALSIAKAWANYCSKSWMAKEPGSRGIYGVWIFISAMYSMLHLHKSKQCRRLSRVLYYWIRDSFCIYYMTMRNRLLTLGGARSWISTKIEGSRFSSNSFPNPPGNIHDSLMARILLRARRGKGTIGYRLADAFFDKDTSSLSEDLQHVLQNRGRILYSIKGTTIKSKYSCLFIGETDLYKFSYWSRAVSPGSTPFLHGCIAPKEEGMFDLPNTLKCAMREWGWDTSLIPLYCCNPGVRGQGVDSYCTYDSSEDYSGYFKISSSLGYYDFVSRGYVNNDFCINVPKAKTIWSARLNSTGFHFLRGQQ